jgi:hypothetical protein
MSPCSATYHGGILYQNWVDGVCTPFWFYIPTIRLSVSLPFNLQFQTNGGSVALLITDTFGKIYQQRFYNRTNNYPVIDEFDLTGFKQGVYILTVYSASHKQTQKFVVVQP